MIHGSIPGVYYRPGNRGTKEMKESNQSTERVSFSFNPGRGVYLNLRILMSLLYNSYVLSQAVIAQSVSLGVALIG